MNVRPVRELRGNTVQMLTTLPAPNLFCFSNEVTLFGWKIPEVRDVLTLRTSHSLYDNNLRFDLRSVLSQMTFFFSACVHHTHLISKLKITSSLNFFFFLISPHVKILLYLIHSFLDKPESQIQYDLHRVRIKYILIGRLLFF